MGQRFRARRARVLVIDDDVDLRRFLEMALTSEGYEVKSAGDARAAILELSRSAFDLVLTDFSLPGENGLLMLKEAERRHLLRGAKVLILTASPTQARQTRVPVLAKSVSMDDLNWCLRRMLETAPESTTRRR